MNVSLWSMTINLDFECPFKCFFYRAHKVQTKQVCTVFVCIQHTRYRHNKFAQCLSITYTRYRHNKFAQCLSVSSTQGTDIISLHSVCLLHTQGTDIISLHSVCLLHTQGTDMIILHSVCLYHKQIQIQILSNVRTFRVTLAVQLLN